MKEDIKVIVIGGGFGANSAALLTLLSSTNIIVIDNDNEEFMPNEKVEFYIRPPAKLKPVFTFPASNNFIQQKMQGKRRVY